MVNFLQKCFPHIFLEENAKVPSVILKTIKQIKYETNLSKNYLKKKQGFLDQKPTNIMHLLKGSFINVAPVCTFW